MDFSLSDMHVEIRGLAHKILGELATMEHLRANEVNGPYLDNIIWQQCIEAGLHAAAMPESLGGSGMDVFAATLVCEAIGQTVASIPFIPCIVSTALPLQNYRQDPVVEKLLTDVVAGKTLITTALLEPGNDEPKAPASTASSSNGKWQVNGIKHCVPYARHSAQVLIFAQADGNLWAGLVNPHGAGCMLVEQSITTREPQYQLTLENAPAHCVAKGNVAQLLLHTVTAMTTVACCSMAIGVADRMMRITGEYTSQREQFGMKIAAFQSVAHRLADCYIDIECLKISTQKATSDVAQGIYDSDAIHMAKVWCGDVLYRVSQASQHMHGGMGIDRDYHLFRYCLWAKQLELMLGNSRTHLEKIGEHLAQKYLAG